MNTCNATASTDHVRLSFPSLEDSPLWSPDFAIPAEPTAEETPPLFVVRAKYPRISKAIELMWGTKEMDTYFSRLIVNDSEERKQRAGFPRDVMAAFLKLSADHASRFKFCQQKGKADVWGVDRFQRHAFDH